MFGVAPTAKAAQVLGHETGMPTDTLAKLLHEHTRPDRPPRPGWTLTPGTTLVVDEAGMIGTSALRTLTQLADQQQWRLVLVGDPRQLQAVGRGGLFTEVCATGRVHELTTVHRFRQPWEADASLALRRGDTSPRAVVGVIGLIPSLVDWRLAILPAIPVAVVWRLLYTRGVLAQRFRDLDELHAFTDTVGHSLSMDTVVDAACTEIRRLLRAEHAAVVAFATDGDDVAGQALIGQPGPLPASATAPQWADILHDQAPKTLGGDTASPLGRAIRAAGRTEAIYAPVRDDQGFLGLIVLADRTGATDRSKWGHPILRRWHLTEAIDTLWRVSERETGLALDLSATSA